MEFIRNFTSDTGLMIFLRSLCFVLPFVIVFVVGFFISNFEVSRRRGGYTEGKWKFRRAICAIGMVIIGVIFVGGILWALVVSHDEEHPIRYIQPTEIPTTQPDIPLP
jgi:hypothetical protein